MSVLEAGVAWGLGAALGGWSGTWAGWTPAGGARSSRRVAARLAGPLFVAAVAAAFALPDDGRRLAVLLAVVSLAVVHRQVRRGTLAVDAGLLTMAREHGLAGWRLWWQVLRPGAAASWLSGLRRSLGACAFVLLLAGAHLPGLDRWLDPAAAPPSTVVGFAATAALVVLTLALRPRHGPRRWPPPSASASEAPRC